MSVRSAGLALLVVVSMPLACTSTPPSSIAHCDGGTSVCTNQCVRLVDDSANCGACGTTCQSAQACAASACYPQDCPSADCSASQVCPAGACVEKACVGVTCPSGSACFQGTCVTSTCETTNCQTGFACINGACTDGSCFGVRCPTGSNCRLGMCVDASTCANAQKDGTESDVDCGGACLTKCAEGSTCQGGNDCSSGRCSSGKCAPGGVAASCSDGKKNGTETDIDCGGACPTKCATNGTCTVGGDCASGACGSGHCTTPSCTDGQKNGSETAVDCGGACPNKCAAGDGCSAHADCQTGRCIPATGLCADLCGNGTKDPLETDVDCGGNCTAKCPNDQHCAMASDCTSKRCVNTVCTGSSCTDSQKDGDETDIDCGGSCTAKCAVDGGCAIGADCIDKVCVAQKCAAPTCSDGQKNGSESDLDCGRLCSVRCATGKRCIIDNDCALGKCGLDGLCPDFTPTCSDGYLNQDEVDTDCGGTKCTACGLGKSCGTPTDCLSGFCSRGLKCVSGFSDSLTLPTGAMWGLGAGDLNGDGVTDLVTADNSYVYRFLGQRDAGFLAPSTVAMPFTYSNPLVALADVGNDGYLDAVVISTNNSGGEALFFKGTATSFLAPTSSSPAAPGTNVTSYVMLDLDADGKLDVATSWGGAGVKPGGFNVMKGGTLGMSAAAQVTITGRIPSTISCQAIAAGNFDTDGKPDLAIGCTPNQVWIALNQGGMVFQLSSSQLITANEPNALLAYDYTGDGKIDLISGDNGGKVGVFEGNGDGTFQPAVNIQASGLVKHLLARDLNGDGKTDLLLGNSGISMFFGDGAGSFTTGPSYGYGYFSTGLATGDFDGDGLIDICLAAANSAPICRYRR